MGRTSSTTDEGDTSGVYQTVRKIWIEFDTFQKLRTDAAQTEVLPHTIHLAQNTPNPFNSSTRITYNLPEPMEMRLVVYDMYGREIQVLASGWGLAGSHGVRFDGGSLPAGVYLCRLETAYGSASRKMVLVK